MKIVYLHQYFNTPSMNGSTRSYEMARRMVEAGHEVHLLSSWREDSIQKNWKLEIIDGIHVHWLAVPYSNSMTFWQRMRAFISYAIGAGNEAIKIGGDLIFASSTPLTIALPAVYASKRIGVPLVFEVRDLWPEVPIAIGALKNPILKFFACRLERFAYGNSERIIALSPGMATGIIDVGVAKAKVHNIPNSCDNELFKPNNSSAEQFRDLHPELGRGPIVLYAGTFGKINGISFFPLLAERLIKTNPEAKLLAIGAGAEYDAVYALAEQIGVLNVNYFQYDAVPKEELVGALHAAQLCTSFVIDIPELHKNSANKFFDSLASGTPIAINHFGWQADLIEQHDIGLVLGPDVDDAAIKLGDLLDEPKRLRKMGENARELALRDFDRDHLAAELIGVLEAAADSK